MTGFHAVAAHALNGPDVAGVHRRQECGGIWRTQGDMRTRSIAPLKRVTVADRAMLLLFTIALRRHPPAIRSAMLLLHFGFVKTCMLQNKRFTNFAKILSCPARIMYTLQKGSLKKTAPKKDKKNQH